MAQATVDDDLKAVTREVDELRHRTESLVEELVRRVDGRVQNAKDAVARVRRIADVRTQVREHVGLSVGIGIGAATLLAVGITVGIVRRRRANVPIERWRRRAHAYREILADPQAVLERPPSVGKKVLAAALSALVGQGIRMLAQRLMARRELEEAHEQKLLPEHVIH